MDIALEDVHKILLSVTLGALIGAERAYRSKAAGLRTMTLITLSATLFTIYSVKLSANASLPPVVIASIVSGIGFLGAGVIYKEEKSVSGLTTAALIWLCAAIGVGIGAGYYGAALTAFLIATSVLVGFFYLEDWIERLNQIRTYRIVSTFEADIDKKMALLFKECKLHPSKGKQSRSVDRYIGEWSVQGSEKRHRKLVRLLLDDQNIEEFDY